MERVWGGGFKKKNDGQTGGGVFVANHVPLFPLFPAHPLPFDKNNVLPWIFSLGANSKMGTIAGTRVLCTQYPARVTKELSIVLLIGFYTKFKFNLVIKPALRKARPITR